MEQKKQHIVDIVFVLLFVYLLCVAFLSWLWAPAFTKAYPKDMTANYNAESSLTYLTEKMRQNDSASSGNWHAEWGDCSYIDRECAGQGI